MRMNPPLRTFWEIVHLAIEQHKSNLLWEFADPVRLHSGK